MPRRTPAPALVLPEAPPPTPIAPTPVQVTPVVAPAQPQNTPPSPQGVPVITPEAYLAMAQKLEALQAQLNAQSTPAPVQSKVPWYGGFKPHAKGCQTKGYNGAPPKISLKGFFGFFSLRGCPKTTPPNLPATPAGVICLAMALQDAAEFMLLPENMGHFDFTGFTNKETGQVDNSVLEHWDEVMERFGPVKA